jgi:hypothetical protein
MSVTRALVGSCGRFCKSCQSAQGKIPEIFLPRNQESCPYDLPWPIATIISTGSDQVWRTVATTVGNDRVRLLAPNKMTRRDGVIRLIDVKGAMSTVLSGHVLRLVRMPMQSHGHGTQSVQFLNLTAGCIIGCGFDSSAEFDSCRKRESRTSRR